MSDATIGVVVIGRNEGERLRRSLNSVLNTDTYVVYVDSASTDDSANIARQAGVDHVIVMTLDRPMSAARARNAGFAALMENRPATEFVQFIDGDCEIAPNWLRVSANFLMHNADYAIVCGLRRELYPNASIYNAICDIEWNGSSGDVSTAGGDFLCRAEVFARVGGFKEHLIAGEDPEFCYRVTNLPEKIWRLPELMTSHDAGMDRFGQWVQRSIRTGFAYAARAMEHWNDGKHYCWRENAAIAIWAASSQPFLY